MHGFLKVAGGIIALGGAVVTVGILIFGINNTAVQIYGLMVGAGLVLPGAMLYCFGAIVEHLIAIRSTNERQLAVLAQMAGMTDGAVPVDTSRWSARDRAAHQA